jgi:uncharacterized protein
MMKDELLKLLKPIALGDKALFDRYLLRYPPEVSELTFTNAFCWAEIRHHLFCELEGHLLISYRQKDCCLSFYPPVGPEPVALIVKKIEGLRDYCWTRLDKTLATSLGPSTRLLLDRDNWDYVYRVEDLRTLKGKDYHGKRNFARRFGELYHPEVRPLTGALASECIHIQEQWLEGQRHNESARDESTALIKALHHFDDLGLRGIGVFTEGSLVAFAIGEPLNPTTFVEHFEKALSEYTGAYQYLLQALALSIPENLPFLNREQDLGVEGLRRAKESWHPARLVEKYCVRVRNQGVARPCEPEAQEAGTNAATGSAGR